PDDRDLLNAIFRGFHTVKGGAGFLQLSAMVDCCHATENLFDQLRNGRCHVTPELMDVVLRALDAVNLMFDNVKHRIPPEPASPELLASLQALARGETLASSQPAQAAVEETPPVADPAPVGDDEFDQLLAALDADDIATSKQLDAAPEAAADDEITEEEFEALLDQLQGKTPRTDDVAPAAVAVESAQPAPDSAAAQAGGSDEITDEEFEALLDQLHGSGR